MRTNKDRRALAEAVLLFYERDVSGDAEQAVKTEVDLCLSDLISDLMHYAKRRKVDFAEVIARAAMHFEAEAGPCTNCRGKDHGYEECTKETKERAG